jgi:hypothetical protein
MSSKVVKAVDGVKTAPTAACSVCHTIRHPPSIHPVRLIRSGDRPRGDDAAIGHGGTGHGVTGHGATGHGGTAHRDPLSLIIYARRDT